LQLSRGVDPRERWQALQSRLTAARMALDRGDRHAALAEVDAALAIDPSFLAAASLRERILLAPAAALPSVEPPAPSAAPPLVSPDGYAKFEQRARRRRVDRKIEAAKDAIARRNLRAAASALDEVIELDPNLPELSTLTAAFDQLRRARATSHRGPTVAAAATFGAVLLGASWIHEGRVLLSHPFATIAHLVDTPSPNPLDLALPAEPDSSLMPAPVATSGRHDAEPARATTTPTVAPLASTSSALVRPPEPTSPTPSSSTPLTPPPSAAPAFVPAATPAPSTLSPATLDVPRPSLPAPSRVDSDETQIARALQQYRLAYEALDAKRAQDVWPEVNETALARAFDSLESQTLTFDACRTQLHGDAAVATCQGTARYVPKIGSREPRVEPRTWTFVMRRTGAEWKIDSARAER